MKAQVSGTLAEPVQTVGARDKVTVYGWKALAGSVIGYSMDGFDLLIVWLHARCHLSGPGPDKHSGRLARYMDVNGRGCGRARFWDHERPFWPNQSADVDDSSIRRIHRSLRSGAGVLGWDLVAYRVMAGLGLRGEFGIGMALAAEAWPASKRARVSSNVALGWQAGVLLAALVTPVLLPVIGWRGMVPGRPAARACGVHRPPHSRRAGDLRQKACCQERKLVSFAGQGSSDIYVLNIISTVFLISEPKGKELD